MRPVATLIRTAAPALVALSLLAACAGTATPPHSTGGDAAQQWRSDAPEVAAAFPPPLDALDQLARSRRASWDGDLLTFGGWFNDELPHNGVTAVDPFGQFTSTWQSSTPPTFADLAYAIYAIWVQGEPEPTLDAGWTSPPLGVDTCFIGVADYIENGWEWHPLPSEGPIALGSLTPHVDDELMLLIVCLLEEGPLQLEWLRLGGNIAPTANLDAEPERGMAPLNVTFDLDGSFDPELDIVLYEWDFDNDGEYDESSATEIPVQHTFETAGHYTVVGRVTDGDGLTGTDELEVWVSGFSLEELASPGYSPSLAILGSGMACISYSGGAETNVLTLAIHKAGEWNYDELDTLAGQDQVQTSLDLDSGDNFALAYGERTLNYATYDGLTFNTEEVTADKGSGQPALALDDDDVPHILYAQLYGEFPFQTRHASHCFKDGANWQINQLTLNEPTGAYCDAEYRGYLVGAYIDRAMSGAVGEIKLGYYSTIFGWTWLTPTTEVSGGGYSIDLAIPSSHEPRFCYVGTPEGGAEYQARYSLYNGEDWDEQVLTPWAWDIALALDADDQPHIVYNKRSYYPDVERLWYTYFDGESWKLAYCFENEGHDMEFLKLRLDSTGTPHVCFTDTLADETTTRVMYAVVE